MSIYRFSEASPIVEAAFRYANDRPPIALLTASADASVEQLSSIRRAIEIHGWQCVPVSVGGREVLQVDGFKNAGHLSGYLASQNFALGEPQITPEKDDHPSRSHKEWLESTGLKAAGALNLVGDVAMLGSGIMSGRNQEIAAGALYTAGATVLTRYGNVKTEHHIREVSERTADFLKQQAMELPEHCSLQSIVKDKRDGILNNTESLLYRYPTETMLGAYTLGAFTMLQSGMKQGNPWDVAYGASSMGVKVLSLLIPEKHKTEAEKKAAQNDGPLGKFVNWVQEKPLRVFGFGSLVTDTLLGLSSLREYRNDPKQRSYIFKFITTGTYIVADLLIAVSSKNYVNANGKFDSEEQRRIEALAAEAIACQPKPMQHDLINQAANFLATQPEMQGTAFDIRRSITEQVEHIGQNPWAQRVTATPASHVSR